jgi:5-methylcytosine-specific restriction endonuclease McrBC GTP-binding regulatory subunit McrB
MPFLADLVNKDSVEKALEYFYNSDEQLNPSTGYDIFFKGRTFPPKEIVRKAAELQGIPDWRTISHNGGEPTNRPLRDMGFQIVEKNQPQLQLITQYKEKIKQNGNKDEIYKWEFAKKYFNRPDVNVTDFFQEIKSIYFKNLIYHNGIAVLYFLAEKDSERLRIIFTELLNESTPLQARISSFSDGMLRFYREFEPNLSAHQDERSMATYLTFHNPNKYTYYKDSFYQKYCKLLGVPAKKKGEKYIHYLSLIEDFLRDFINKDSELLKLKNDFLNADCFPDNNNLLLAQDILYQILDSENKNDEDHYEVVEKISFDKQKSSMNLNTILYGPPGTGKTYKTIELAFNIINESLPKDKKTLFSETISEEKKRSIIREKFNEFRNSRQIEFITFHQSMSYEDFIEGIKPFSNEDNNQVQYRVEGGLFKRCCAQAGYYAYEVYSRNTRSTTYTFDDLYNAFLAQIDQNLEKGNPVIYKTLRNKDARVERTNENLSIIISGKSIGVKNLYLLTKENLQKLYDNFTNVDEIKDLKQIQDIVQVHVSCTNLYAVFKGLKDFEKDFIPSKEFISNQESEPIDYVQIENKFNEGIFDVAYREFTGAAQPVVLIIDEINRGNIAAIFGELITLLEEDKRLGNKESLKIKLPYSKRDFGIPANLYIIGTMNTADRSVEALDTALRRRFSFLDTPPIYQDLTKDAEGVNIQEILKNINKRLEILIDKDHQIGHAWFWNINTVEGLKKVFADKILPLLQEYFYNDYDKLSLVLGPKFFNSPQKVKREDFAQFDTGWNEVKELIAEYNGQTILKLIDVDQLSKKHFQSIYITNSEDNA